MRKMTINHQDEKGTVEYIVYTRREADDAGIEYKHWQDAETGEYALSDDGYVAKVILRKSYTNRPNRTAYYIRFPFGYEMWNPQYPTKKMKFEGRKSAYTLTGKPTIENLVRSEKVQNLALCYAQVFNRDLAILLSMGEVSPSTRHTYRRIMKTERFKTMVSAEIRKQLEEHGLNEAYTLNLLKEVIEIAKGKSDVTNLMRVVENLQEMHGMRGNRTKRSIAVEEHITKRIIDDIDEERRKIEVEQEVDG